MRLQKIAFLIVATLACGSAAVAKDGGRVGTGHHRFVATRHVFIVRRPFPIQQPPASTSRADSVVSPSMIDSRIDSRVGGNR
jgi:hypothetical protein